MNKTLNPENIKTIVVRGTNWVGDAVMTIPALRELRRIFPTAKITLCTRSWAKGIFQDADFIDNILVYDKELPSHQAFLKQAKIWREQSFDLAVLFTNSFESALLANTGKAKLRFGYATEKRGVFLSHAVKVPSWKKSRHEVFYYLNLVSEIQKTFFGVSEILDRVPQFNLKVSAARAEKAREMLDQLGIDQTKKTIALCPGSTNSRAKRWPVSYYAALADLLMKELNANVILVGAPDEIEVSDELKALSTSKPFNLTGKTTLDELVSILTQVDLLISNDTGPSHIAPALDTKTLVIFGPTDPTTTRPFGERAKIVRNAPDCAPCMLRDCPIDHRCMTAISANEIFRTAKEMLAS